MIRVLVIFILCGVSYKTHSHVCERVFANFKSYLPLGRKASVVQKREYNKQALAQEELSFNQFDSQFLLGQKLAEAKQAGHVDRVYNIHFTESDSLMVYRIKRIIQESQRGFLVKVEFLNPVRGNIQTLEIFIHKDPELPFEIDPFYSFSPKLPPRYIHPDAKIVFESARSGWFKKRKSVSMVELPLSSRTNKSEELKEQGYEPFYRKGIDDLNEWAEVRKKLEALRANPYTTHIEYFANKIESHIHFFIESLNRSSITLAQKQTLDQLTKSAKKAIKQKKVTYKWWVFFNIRLSYMLSNREFILSQGIIDGGSGLTPGHIGTLISWFPVVMMVPSLLGEVGIMALSRSPYERVYPFGLIRENKYVDGRERDPAQFVMHDIGHIGLSLISQMTEQYSDSHRLRHKKMQTVMESLPIEKRKPAELVYWILVHESQKDILLGSQSREEIKNQLIDLVFSTLLRGTVPLNMVQIGSEPVNLILVEKNPKPVVDIFMKEVYDKIF